MKPTARCKCPIVNVLGEEHVEWPHPDCSVHGRPETSRFLAGDPLVRYAKVVDKRTGEVITLAESNQRLESEMERYSNDWIAWMALFRDETPREVEARLFSEISA